MAEPAKPGAPAEVPIGPVEESVTYSLLDDLKRGHKVTDDEYDEYRDLYSLMHGRMVETREKEKSLSKLAS